MLDVDNQMEEVVKDFAIKYTKFHDLGSVLIIKTSESGQRDLFGNTLARALLYELEGCQKAVNFLTKHYGVRRMKIRLKGRKVGNGDIAVYFQNRAYFTKRGLTKRTVLHELYHHLVYVNGLDISKTKEERAANSFARDFLNRLSVHA